MEDKLRLYLWWKGKLSERKAEGKAPIALPKGRDDDTPISEALKKKDKERMERAAMLLRATQLPVREVARQVGYSGTSNFYRAFRAQYGCGPAEWRAGAQK